MKFIFISGYQEFTYAKEALQSGAVDYLLKPVARKDLEDAVRKAIQKLEEQNTIEIFKEEDDEMYQLFREINDGQGFENDELYQLFEAEEIDFEGHFFVGICVGIRPDLAADMIKDSFERFNLLRFSIYNQIAQKLRGKAFVLRKDDCALHLMGVFPCGEEDTFVETYVMPVVQQVSAQVHIELSVGIGMYSTDAKQLKNAYKTAKFAFELYYFEEKPLIDFREIHKDYTVSFEDYAKSVDEAYHAIIAHDESYLEKIDKIMDKVEAIHYGNKNAALSRVLYFVAEIGTKLFQYQLIEGDYNEMQEKLQKDTESRKTFRALRECIRNYYQNLWILLDNNGKSKDKVMIEQVKDYIKAHYAEDHGINYVMYAPASEEIIEEIFSKRFSQKMLTKLEMEQYKTACLLFFSKEYKKRGWVMQLHYGCKRDNNQIMYQQLGPDTGYDCINNYAPAEQLTDFLNAAELQGGLPRTILYSLNPGDDTLIDSVIGCFQNSDAIGKMQHGSSWWFNDNKTGMEKQMTSLANLGMLANFVGMLTDSRSFLSYPRHEYFRRILCNLLGTWVENGEYPDDMKRLGKIVKDISYNNAVRYFGFDLQIQE